jgi:hypothetical protein
MLEVKSEKMVKCFFPKSCLDDLGGVLRKSSIIFFQMIPPGPI